VGLQETISYPLVSLENLRKVRQLDPEVLPLRIANPMSAGQEYLRPTLRASLLLTLLYNQERSRGPFRLFEMGRVFLPREGDLPEEREMVTGVLSGLRSEPSWQVENGLLDFFDAKGMVSSALDRLGITVTYEPVEDPTCHPGRCAKIMSGEEQLGIIGEVHPAVRASFDLEEQPITIFEVDLHQILTASERVQREFKSLSRFPAAIRDLALVVSSDVPAGKVQDILTSHRLVEHVELFDVYTGGNIPPGSKSLAFHVYFQAGDHTLTTEEINRSLEGLMRTLERETGAQLRAS
jgi:phenylalanyl-tRNA synthetase beta chain